MLGINVAFILSHELSSDLSLPDELNAFYACFEASKSEPCMRALAVNIHKAAGPDSLPGCVLRAYADQLLSFFTDIFNLSLNKSVIPTCFKQTTIVPVPTKVK